VLYAQGMNKVLVINDEVETLTAIKSLLGQSGFEVDCVQGREEAEVFLGNNNYQVVIAELDLNRPSGLDSIAVLDHVYENCPNTRIVVIAGSATPEIVIHACAFRIDGYLRKPFLMDVLSRTVSALTGAEMRQKQLLCM
jgi:DNA-binding NtrC family response regulator